MKVELVTVERIDKLLRFLPLFDQPGRKFIESWGGGETTPDGTTTVPFPIYASDVIEFFRLAGQRCWSDRQYDPAEAGAMLEHDSIIQSASVDQIRTMLTYCVRGERFCDGHWASVLESGRVAALLHRLKVLRSTLLGPMTGGEPTAPRRAPATESVGPATLFLVSCVSQKRSEPSRARDLYTSQWFTKARAFVESHASPWFILSAEHGLLGPDSEIAPYERSLARMSVADRREWARRVLVQLRPKLIGVQRVVLLAGTRYREYLLRDIRALCPVVDVPLEGLGIGKQLRWLNQQDRMHR